MLNRAVWRGVALRIIEHAVCKVVITCNETTGFRENKVSGICVYHQDHIASVIADICI